MRAREILSEGLIAIPPKMYEEMRFYLTFYMLWHVRDKFKGKTRLLPEHFKAFKALCRKLDIELPSEPYKPEKGHSIHHIKMNLEGMPSNYQHLAANVDSVMFVVDWGKTSPKGYWFPKHNAIIVRPLALDWFTKYPREGQHSDDLHMAVDDLSETIRHELRHMVQYLLLGDHPEQTHQKPRYGEHKADYHTSPIEFDPIIGSHVQEFLGHWKLYPNAIPLSKAVRQFVGAERSPKYSPFETTRFWSDMKHAAPERYKVGVKKFVVALKNALPNVL